MHLHRAVLGWTAVLLTGVSFLLIREARFLPDGQMHVSFLDVGQGDAVLIRSPSGRTMLVDGGPDAGVLSALGREMPFFDRSIDLVILTHPDADHVGGLPAVLRRYRAGAVLFPQVAHPTAVYADFLREIATQRIPVLRPDPGADLSFGDGMKIDVLWPPAVLPEDIASNDLSTVIRMSHGSGDLLLTGDIEEDTEDRILATGETLESEIFKAPHHGSKTSSSTGFLLAADPLTVVISVAAQNRYGHPHPSVTARYAALGIPVITTAREGTVSLTLGADGRIGRRDTGLLSSLQKAISLYSVP